jgi:hypothetical protein
MATLGEHASCVTRPGRRRRGTCQVGLRREDGPEGDAAGWLGPVRAGLLLEKRGRKGPGREREPRRGVLFVY